LAYFKSKKIDYPKFDLDIVNKVDSIVSGFNFTSKTTDREKVDAVSNYVTNHLEYQNAIGDISIVSSIIYGAGVCNEYALLEYTLLKVVGVDAYFMAGYGDTAVYNRNYFSSVPHAWNMVKIDGTWYGLDVTWIDGVSEYYKDTYYMVKPSTDITWDEYLSDPNKYSDELFGLTHVTYNNPQYNVYEDKNVGEDGYFSKNNGVVQSPTTAIETSAPRYVWGYWVIAGVAVSMLFVILVTIARKEKE